MSRLPEVQAVTKQELSISLNTGSLWCPLARRRLEILGEVHPGREQEQEQAPAGQGLPTRRLPRQPLPPLPPCSAREQKFKWRRRKGSVL